MIFRIIGTILLGGGALGASAGWLTIKYLDARRSAKQLRKALNQNMRRRQQESAAALDLSPGAVWEYGPDNQMHSLNYLQMQLSEWAKHAKDDKDALDGT